MWTYTWRGMWWLLLSLGIGLVAYATSYGTLFLALTAGVDLGAGFLLAISWMALLTASALLGFVALGRLLRGGFEYGPEHARNLKWGSVAFAVGGIAALVYFVTGIALGFGYVPDFSVSGGALRDLHNAAPIPIAVFAGLFLLGALWRLGTSVSRGVDLAAFVVGLIVPLWLGLGRLVFLPSLTTPGILALELTPVLSVGLWLVAALLTATHLRGTALAFAPNPVTG